MNNQQASNEGKSKHLFIVPVTETQNYFQALEAASYDDAVGQLKAGLCLSHDNPYRFLNTKTNEPKVEFEFSSLKHIRQLSDSEHEHLIAGTKAFHDIYKELLKIVNRPESID